MIDELIQKYYCYILTNKNRSVLYIGFTDNLKRRLNQHKKSRGVLFTKKYNAIDLVYYEEFVEKNLAKSREKQLKNWHRAWKWNLVKETNPKLKTLNL